MKLQLLLKKVTNVATVTIDYKYMKPGCYLLCLNNADKWHRHTNLHFRNCSTQANINMISFNVGQANLN